ncbi:MAG: amidohydrolase family protein [Pirellulales bacterium]|nr:amidohydrolase family protein [Pirellulales bacterium]
MFAIVGATLVPEPGQKIEGGTIVLRDGIIERLGPQADVQVPADAERIAGEGLIVYPGFLDGLTYAGIDQGANRSHTGAGRPIDYTSFAMAATPPDNRNGLTPEFLATEALTLDEAAAGGFREAGFTAVVAAPQGGIATGQSALVSTSGLPRREIVLESPVALHINLTVPGGGRSYPSTLMGCVAHLRQAMIDAQQYDDAWRYFEERGGRRPPLDPTLAALRAAQRHELPVFWQADTRDEIDRALDLANEFGVRPVIVGGREAWRSADRLAAAKIPVVLQIDFPEEPRQGSGKPAADAMFADYTVEQLEEGLKRPDLPPAIKRRIEARLKELKEEPDQPAKPKAGKDGDKPKVPESPRVLTERQRLWREAVGCAAALSKAGVKFCFSSAGHKKPGAFTTHLRAAIEQGLAPDAALAALTTASAEVLGVEQRLGKLAPGYAAHAVAFDGPLEAEKTKLRYVFVDSERFEYNAPPAAAEKDKAESPPAGDKPAEPAAEQRPDDKSAPDKPAEDQPAAAQDTAAKPAEEEPYATEIEADRKPSFATGGNVVIRDATVLTVTNGTLPKATIVVRNGRIEAVGPDVAVPEGLHVVDGTGLYVMPGILDPHVHFAITRGINEMTLSVTPEVSIADVINGDDLQIYRELAGGVTCVRVLHGSANAIGGQHAVIKLRWGRPGRELIVRDAPRGVKFALGENPKRGATRYPDTRLGVESTIRRSFDEGRMYRRVWEQYAMARSRGEQVAEPRRDLRLEALADILDGKLRIHCHCYRADEILMLLRLTESYGVRVQSLQHVLEGYKVAPEIAAHGASCSAFADWWAYKIEAYDAIPYCAALLEEAGVNAVTLKSDDNELGRHMYQDAAKMLKYGQMSEQQCLALITINVAKQLGIEQRIGSIEVGKDADLAIFNGHPLNAFSRCEMTLVDGEVYFERRAPRADGSRPLPVAADELRKRQVQIAESGSGRYVLRNATIVPVVGEPVEHGTLVVAGGKIEAIAGAEYQAPSDAVEIDLAGLSIYPGMINAGGALGLVEIGSIEETHDYAEGGEFNADLRASIAVHPDSELIPVTRANGVLTVLTQPTGGRISGQSVLMNLAGWIPPEMAVVDPLALHVNFPSGLYKPGSVGQKSDEQQEASKQIEALREQFTRSLQYDELVKQAAAAGQLPPVPDPPLAALIPYAHGERPVVIHADLHGDILAAIEFAQGLKLKWILADAQEAWKCAAAIKAAGVPVILGPSMQLPGGEFDPYDAPYANAARLHEAGIPFCIKAVENGPGSGTAARNLPYQAAMAVAYGLPEAEGLKAVTLYPAQILGAADKLGSLEVGKLANLIITDGNPLQPGTDVKWLFIGGKPLAPTSKHTQLYARYQERLRQVRSGQRMLGVGQPGGSPASGAGDAASQ